MENNDNIFKFLEHMFNMDEKDLIIINTLKANGGLRIRQISKKTGIPITTAHKRIRKLKDSGVIKRYTIELDNKKMGLGLSAYVLVSVSLKQLKAERFTQHDLAKKFHSMPNIEKVDIVTGGPDLLLQVRVKDVDELDRILLGEIQKIEGVSHTKTLVVIKEFN
jgi:Lrp/AsnC family leucine-responsive transcriptional regulator